MMGGGGASAATSNSANADKTESLFAPLIIPPPANGVNLRTELERNFTTTSRFITIECIGRVGHSQRRLRTVVNFDDKWTAPPPNTAQAQPLGVFSYYRAE
jgi:hypothetical protein